MAASVQTDVTVSETEGEISSPAQTEATEIRVDPGGEDLPAPEPPTEEPFKKPAFFAAPSRVAATSRRIEAPARDPSTPDITDEIKKEDKDCDSNQEANPVKPVAKQRTLPPKAPPAGPFPPIPYAEPPWGGVPPELPYALEILKNGTIVDTVPLADRSYFVVGRLPVCDVSLEHPSISRYHAVVQYRGQSGDGESVGEERGFYVHDLGSTHGTVVNKNKVPPKTYIRLRVGHVIKFGGSTRLFILQGPEFDEEEESELTVTELRERARKQKADLEKRMMGDGSDDDDDDDDNKEDDDKKDEEGESNKGKSKGSQEDSGCSWGIAEEAAPEEDENEENPFSTEFHEDQEAAYLKDPKKALQGFYDREGEELEFEYEDQSHGSWLCRIKLPVDDALGRQLVAEVTHTGKKKEAAIQCCLEACRMLEARGLLRQEAVSRKRKKKNWEDEDYYDSDDDTFLDRTGTVERKRQERMKKAGKIEERVETYDSLVAKLSEVEKELADTQKKLNSGKEGSSSSSAEDSLDAFMTAVRSEAAMDAVDRRKLHVHMADLRREAQRLRKLVELTRPAQMPTLQPGSETEKLKKTLPLFGAMKGGSKFKLKTGTIGKLPPKRSNLPEELFNMKDLPSGVEEEEEEEEDENQAEEKEHKDTIEQQNADESISDENDQDQPAHYPEPKDRRQRKRKSEESAGAETQELPRKPSSNKAAAPVISGSKAEGGEEPAAGHDPKKKQKKRVMGPSRPPVQLSAQYPDDDPDYSVWMPPAGQSGDGRTHLNDKYGY